MYFFVVQLLILIKISISAKFERYCIADTQCRPGEQCIANRAGLLVCQQNPNNVPGSPAENRCQYDYQCPGYGGKCVRIGWDGLCQYETPGWKIPGAVNDRCNSDADCAEYLQCAFSNGAFTCQITPGRQLPYKECQSSADCNFFEQCIFSIRYKQNLCTTIPQYQSTTTAPFWDGSLGGGVVPNVPIGSGALPSGFEKKCSADYQCPVYEICASSGNLGDRVCTYNLASSNRQCRFNADCPNKQRCEKSSGNKYFCKTAELPTLMQPCTYDYECSAGEHCSSNSPGASYQQTFRRCLPKGEELN